MSVHKVYKIGQSDLKALEDFLEQRQYFFGEEISMLDIEVFAFTTQVLFYDKGEFNLFLKGKQGYLLDYRVMPN